LTAHPSEAASLAAEAPEIGEHHFEILFGLGGMILLVAWLPILLKRLPLALPIVCVAIGAAFFSVEPFASWAAHPDKTPTLVERVAELMVIVSLMGAGLKIERAVGWKSWNVTWRLLAIFGTTADDALAAAVWRHAGCRTLARHRLGGDAVRGCDAARDPTVGRVDQPSGREPAQA
jgi:hypothetical protein